MKTTYDKGIEAENLACTYLQKNKFCIIGKRIKNKEGEIDILAQKIINNKHEQKDYYIFEVKARKSFEIAGQSIYMHQINRSINAFYIYAQEKNIEFEQIYIMAILVSGKSLQIVNIDELD